MKTIQEIKEEVEHDRIKSENLCKNNKITNLLATYNSVFLDNLTDNDILWAIHDNGEEIPYIQLDRWMIYKDSQFSNTLFASDSKNEFVTEEFVTSRHFITYISNPRPKQIQIIKKNTLLDNIISFFLCN